MNARLRRSPLLFAFSFPIALGLAACSSAPETTSTAGARATCDVPTSCPAGERFDDATCQCVPTGFGCPQFVLCVRGLHWDRQACRCAADDDGGTAPNATGDDAGAPPPADAGCVDKVLCVRGDHWDPQLCSCVPDGDAGPGCFENVLCMRGNHWDHNLCRCVQDDDGGTDAGAPDACTETTPGASQ